ncbi:hypothetical protein F8M41_007860 [Gigaspora margarita]|uniref:Uncharacterized protein n=1 Tax=Gigaspora margarita TaxID=4874 RepID=A0A8H3X4G0_GIGMA|nr:hypothetical protein F8M41_007860 [Gigaspora margarita]
MGIYKSYKLRSQARQAAQKSVEKRQAISRNRKSQSLINDLDQEQLDNIYKMLTKEQVVSHGDGELESFDNEEQEFSHDDEISKEEYQKSN